MEKSRKGTAAEVPVQEQLTEQEIYCMAKHIQWLLKEYARDQEYGCACGHCKYHHNRCENGFRNKLFESKIPRVTGVTTSFWKGFKIEEAVELH